MNDITLLAFSQSELISPFINLIDTFNHILILTNDLQNTNQNIKSDLDNIWETLNFHYHKKFGSSDEIKKLAKQENLQWARTILLAYVS